MIKVEIHIEEMHIKNVLKPSYRKMSSSNIGALLVTNF